MATTAAARVHAAERGDIENALKRRVSGEVRFDPFSRVLYSTDASIYQMEPVGVVIPRNVEDVLAVIEVAKENRVPVLPRAGGTSLAGQTVNHAIVVDFSKYLNQIIEVNQEEQWARVQPGIVLDDLNRQLVPHGLMYAPDPTTSSRACVGGGVGNNTCGAHSVIYGKTLDHIKELDVILSDGTQTHFNPLEARELEAKLSGVGLESDIYRGVRRLAQENAAEIEARYPNIMRRVSGYNLDEFLTDSPFNMTKMVVGSEGTLCVVTEVKINLVPRPTMTALGVVHFEDIFGASEAVKDILAHEPSSIEILDRNVLERSKASTGLGSNMAFIEGNPGAVLVVEFYGESEAELADKTTKLKDDMSRRSHGYATVNMLDRASQASVWAVRKNGLGLLMSMHGDAKPLPFVEDTAVDPENMGPFVRRFDEIVRNHQTEAAYYGHASVGCLHIRPVVSLKSQDGVDKMLSIADEISDLVKEFGGSLSGEHGDGIVRGVWNQKMFGPEIYKLFQELKGTFDPDGIMNPGKIIDCPPMDQNLRYGSDYRAKSLPTKLDFSIDTDFAGAVEMCNGMGACRQHVGTMCPSYVATRDEEHSTRGRANLLRAALSGKLPEGTMTSRRLYEAMDLCLECKGCKSECESGVDMAKLKYEFLDQYHRANGTPLRNRVFANINRLSAWGSRTAPLSNLMTGNPIGRMMAQMLLGVTPKRKTPKFVRQTFAKWFKGRGNPHRSAATNTRGGSASVTATDTVVLLNDTYMNYNYPEIGKAAVALLEAAGFKVLLSDTKCCGRPMISKGLLDDATANAVSNVEQLHAYAEQGIPVIGCEPSCLLTFRDEYPELVRDEKAKKVAGNSFMIDEFLVKLMEDGKLELDLGKLEKKVLFQAHCHQKADMGTATSLAALRLAPGYQVELINAGCCGMAGSFGYEKEHYDLSMKIGEEALFPAIRAKGDDWEVAVMGVSCRQQVEHGTGRKARHLVEVLADALG
ncbi:MAG: FAD-binding protein [Chloroflexi bacterium]|nr:FAD-binding protein [Chloroflexota bacterium]MDA1270471.1 FAD-binding protein [Chloroflexota bacterium]